MKTERKLDIYPMRCPEWVVANFGNGQEVRIYSLSAEEADALLVDFCCRFRERFVQGKEDVK